MEASHAAGLFTAVEDSIDPIARRQPAVINKISIKHLFGRYSYSIPAPDSDISSGPINRLMLLYGDNGCGKTTVLRLIYHLLSPASRRGHRTFIARTPFAELTISFTNGTSVTVTRPENELRGTFFVTIVDRGISLDRIPFEASEDLSIRAESTPEELQQQEQFALRLRDLNLRPYYLADDRSIYSDAIDDDERLGILRGEQEFYLTSRLYRDRMYREEMLPRELRQGRELTNAINRAEEWIRQQAFRGTNTGSASTNALYLDVLRRIATSTSPSQRDSSAGDEKSIEQRLAELGQRTTEYSEFGLRTPLPSDEFLAVVSQAPRDRSKLIADVLAPHLEGIQARLDALKDVQQLLMTFTSSVNSFLTDKALRFDVRQGISISTGDAELPPLALSSGERQLLLLLCSILVARDDTRLFIIDEPEISLNVKWQRRLLDALLDCTAGTDMQFLVATHSIEMIAGHSQSLARLVNERE
jgi:energy-coupling factor transporter ATP-binding protein EcfA2